MGLEGIVKICEFRGKFRESPEKHIESLEYFFKCQGVSDEIKVYIAHSYIYEEALEWWDALKEKPSDFETYKQRIREGFWGYEIQQNVMEEINKNQWDERELISTFMRRQIARL